MLDTNVVGEIRVLLRVPPELHAALTKLARRETRSLNGQLIHMLRQGLPSDLAADVKSEGTIAEALGVRPAQQMGQPPTE